MQTPRIRPRSQDDLNININIDVPRNFHHNKPLSPPTHAIIEKNKKPAHALGCQQ
ncbi:hypothetical protein BDW71DRAFT_180030 [Aspergillus fruticulosus]